MGAQLRQTRRRIRSVQSTMKITRAMELIAASRIVRAQRRVEQARPYALRIAEAIRELSGVAEAASEFPLLREREIRTVGVVVVTSDRGLAGAYNSNVIRLAERLLRDIEVQGRAFRLHLVGKKGVSYFRFRGYAIASQTTGVSDTPSYDDAVAVGRRLMAEFESGEVDQVLVCYTDFKNVVVQQAAHTQVLPIRKEEIVTREPGAIPPLYEFEPEPGAILALLLPRYVITVVYAALLESAASEHASRRRAMKVATDNAQELIGVLTRQANRQRQAEITMEIMDIIGGAEALRKQETAAAR